MRRSVLVMAKRHVKDIIKRIDLEEYHFAAARWQAG